jgi:3-deoxy-manno-octulosonate cytidylyltransferase (CMP-KDO synthetase)
MTNAIILIPARLASTRLPGKPLADINGVAMIAHVLRRAQAAEICEAVVATDSEAIATAVEKSGGRAIMTRSGHLSGSDRVFEALESVDPEHRIEIVINVQGDLPTIDPADIRAALVPLLDPAVHIATLAAVIDDPAELTNPNVVKVHGKLVALDRLHGARRWNDSSNCRRLQTSGAKASNSCVRSMPACVSMSPSLKASPWELIRPMIWPKPVRY